MRMKDQVLKAGGVVVEKVFSDSAREAAAEARRGGAARAHEGTGNWHRDYASTTSMRDTGSPEDARTQGEHTKAALWHDKQAAEDDEVGNTERAQMHTVAASAHREAAAGDWKTGRGDVSQLSQKARGLSREANETPAQ